MLVKERGPSRSPIPRHREGCRRSDRRQSRKVGQARGQADHGGLVRRQVMKATGAKANPQAVNDLVKAKLGIEE